MDAKHGKGQGHRRSHSDPNLWAHAFDPRRPTDFDPTGFPWQIPSLKTAFQLRTTEVRRTVEINVTPPQTMPNTPTDIQTSPIHRRRRRSSRTHRRPTRFAEVHPPELTDQSSESTVEMERPPNSPQVEEIVDADDEASEVREEDLSFDHPAVPDEVEETLASGVVDCTEDAAKCCERQGCASCARICRHKWFRRIVIIALTLAVASFLAWIATHSAKQ